MAKDYNEEFSLIHALPYLHRKILDQIGNDPNFPKTTKETKYEIATREMRRELTRLGHPGFQPMPYSQVIEMVNRIRSMAPERYIQYLEDEGFVSGESVKVLAELLQILKSETKLRFRVARIEELTGFVRANIQLNSRERTALLAGLTTAPYDLKFWAEVKANPKSPYHSLIKDEKDGTVYRTNWADIIGMIIGCIFCLLAGPASCMACAGLGGSLASAIFDTN